jgi:hypothetical protein
VQGPSIALLVAIPSLILAIAGLGNTFISRREVKGKSEAIWMTMTKESTDLVLARLEELKRENVALKRENIKCQADMANLKRWLRAQGLTVPPEPSDDELPEV